MGKHATYYNYKNGETIIQLFSVKATDESVSFYLIHVMLVILHQILILFKMGITLYVKIVIDFIIDEIGLTKTYGCSPIAILDEDKKIDNDLIIISSNFIESYQSQFENINIYK